MRVCVCTWATAASVGGAPDFQRVGVALDLHLLQEPPSLPPDWPAKDRRQSCSPQSPQSAPPPRQSLLPGRGRANPSRGRTCHKNGVNNLNKLLSFIRGKKHDDTPKQTDIHVSDLYEVEAELGVVNKLTKREL